MNIRDNIYLSTFLNGILFFFSLEKNPIAVLKKQMSSKSDIDNIASDWRCVGNDIRKAYERYETTNY